MKRAKWFVLILPLVLLSGSVVVAKKRMEAKRKLLLTLEFKRALDDRDSKRMIHLLAMGANPNVNDSSGLSALEYAAGGIDDTRALEDALFRAGVDVNRLNARGEPPLAAAISICGGCGCVTNDDQAIELIKHGARAEVSYGKKTPLLDSAEMVDFAPQENLHLIPVLLRFGADANKRNSDGKTAYDLVAHSFGPDAKQEKQRRHVLALLKAAMHSQSR